MPPLPYHSSKPTTRQQQQLEWELRLAPAHFGREIKREIRERLIQERRGATLENGAVIVEVLDVADDDMGEGHLDPLTGEAKYHVTYEALLFRFFKGEVCDGVVTTCQQHGFYAHMGPSDDMFVSSRYMPTEYKFKRESDSWETDADDGEAPSVIKAGTEVRVKVESSNPPFGTINEDYLGDLSPE